MLTNIDFNRLKVFHFVYTCESIVGAAARLNVTRSAISQHLKKFENEIGTKLFTRMNRSLVPTTEAQLLHTIIAPFFQELEIGLKTIQQGKNEPSGILKIGAPVEFGQTHLPAILGGFRNRYNKVTFSITFGDPEKLVRMVRSGELDFSLVDLFLTQGEYFSDSGIFSISPIIDEDIILICSKRYAANALQNNFSLMNLLRVDYIAYHQNSLALKSWFKHHYGKTAISPHIVLTVDSVRAVVSAVENDIGLGIVPYHVVYNQINTGTIVSVASRKKDIINTISLLQLQDKIPSLTEKRFHEYFAGVVAREEILKQFSRRACRVKGN